MSKPKQLSESELKAIEPLVRLRLVLDDTNPPSTPQEAMERAAKLAEQALEQGFPFLDWVEPLTIREEPNDQNTDEPA